MIYNDKCCYIDCMEKAEFQIMIWVKPYEPTYCCSKCLPDMIEDGKINVVITLRGEK